MATMLGAPSGMSSAQAWQSPAPITVSELSPNAALTARDLSVSVTNAPGAGNTRQFELLIAGASSPLLHCTISDTATTCSSGSQTGSIPAGSELVISEVLSQGQSGPPAPADALFGWRASS